LLSNAEEKEKEEKKGSMKEEKINKNTHGSTTTLSMRRAAC
jgi:hypothetical protein